MIQHLTPQQAYELIQRGDVDVVDVREPSEWTHGHVPGARLVPLGQLRANLSSVLGRDGVLFVCAAGVRSLTAAKIAEGLGLKTLYNLRGGTTGWGKAGLPLVHDATAA